MRKGVIMLKLSPPAFVLLILCLAHPAAHAQKASATPAPSPSQQQPAMAFDEWADNFDGQELDPNKWERFTFEGGGGGKAKVEQGELRMRGMGGSRAGVRSKPTFVSDRFIAEAAIARVGSALPELGESSAPPGNAILTILFDGSGRNRIEWILTSEGHFEAWSVVDGKGERLDNRTLGTKIKNPIIAIVRRGDEFLFVLNAPGHPAEDAQVGVTKTIKNLPRSFRVMLYGYGSSENDWDSVRVVTPKKP
jgi:hypothetical protein